MQAMKGMKTLRSGRNRKKWIYVLLLMGLLRLSGCSSPSSASMEASSEASLEESTDMTETSEIGQTELVKTGSMELQYAENFTVDYYEGGYKMLTTLPDEKKYLLVPEGQSVPEDTDDDICILQEPLQNIPGMVPNMTEVPEGCRFCPRCECATERCKTEKPDLYLYKENHKVRCFLYENKKQS